VRNEIPLPESSNIIANRCDLSDTKLIVFSTFLMPAALILAKLSKKHKFKHHQLMLTRD
jgi:hypothetical protein